MKKYCFLLFVALVLFLPSCSKTDSANKKKIVYWSMWNEVEPQGQVIKSAIEDFMKKNPDITVEINWNGRDIVKILQPALDNNQQIDLCDDDLGRTSKVWKGYAMPLDDYLTKTYDTTEGKPYEEVVIPSLVKVARDLSGENKVYAMPYQPYVTLILYNKDHFAKAGITKTPETWSEFKDTCAKLKAAGFTPFTVDDIYINTIYGYQLARYIGVDGVSNVVYGDWKNPAALQAAKDWEEMYKLGYISSNVAGNKYPQGQQEIANGEVSMYLNGTWLVNEVMPTTGPDFPWGQFAYPTVPGGKLNLYDLTYGGQSLQINKNTQYPDEVFKLIVHLTTGEWDKQLAEKTYGVPMANTTEWPKQLSDAKDVFSKLENALIYAGGVGLNKEKTPIIAANFTRLITGQITAEQFISEVSK